MKSRGNKGINDLVQLKMEKKLLEAKLANVKKESKKLNKIIDKKTMDKASTLYRGASLPEMSTTVLGNMTLNDLRVPKRSCKVDPMPPPRDLDEVEPTPIPFGSNLERIRHQHIRRTVGKVEIAKRNKVKNDKAAKKAVKEQMRHSGIKIAPSMFPNRYLRGELPCTIEHGVRGLYLSWVCPLDNLDYDYYLPIFFDGLQCDQEPIVFLAKQGIEDMLYACHGNADRVIPSLPNLVRPLRNALSKFSVPILLNVLTALKQLVQCADGVGVAMTPYYKQFLQPMNAFLDRTKNIGDEMDFGQRKNNDVGEEVRTTLEIMEKMGGPDAFKCIKFAIPPYQSYREGLL
mmetsp:Transcript_16382/g.24694  ORF Transcript_16382/g.24694 Transcript_16382/m.24694 type:complete len:345 (+) Transcript_16382:196-1230(+)|eukprot:CAMPEP_0185028568 /NCGR_PEP_ID=MMETSP1103-20130426/14354_1 /TAXON_ID=36769 /ORGANISM="Paraphysomonas bandaiensis, Strain Caron Lab Isolate" /LENGTH=344 /DNA_ID=CAMNT_0027563019 /DNA_START=136 /DNA_END=1170 /DNA_ORIENTATION=-